MTESTALFGDEGCPSLIYRMLKRFDYQSQIRQCLSQIAVTNEKNTGELECHVLMFSILNKKLKLMSTLQHSLNLYSMASHGGGGRDWGRQIHRYIT